MNAFAPYAAQLRWTFRSSNLITHTPKITSTLTFSCGFSRGMKQLISFYLELESSSSSR